MKDTAEKRFLRMAINNLVFLQQTWGLFVCSSWKRNVPKSVMEGKLQVGALCSHLS